MRGDPFTFVLIHLCPIMAKSPAEMSAAPEKTPEQSLCSYLDTNSFRGTPLRSASVLAQQVGLMAGWWWVGDGLEVGWRWAGAHSHPINLRVTIHSTGVCMCATIRFVANTTGSGLCELLVLQIALLPVRVQSHAPAPRGSFSRDTGRH